MKEINISEGELFLNLDPNSIRRRVFEAGGWLIMSYDSQEGALKDVPNDIRALFLGNRYSVERKIFLKDYFVYVGEWLEVRHITLDQRTNPHVRRDLFDSNLSNTIEGTEYSVAFDFIPWSKLSPTARKLGKEYDSDPDFQSTA